MTSFGSYSQEGGTGMRNYEMRFYGFKKSENEDYGDIFLSAKSENSSLNRSERVVFFPLAYPTKNCLYYRLLSLLSLPSRGGIGIGRLGKVLLPHMILGGSIKRDSNLPSLVFLFPSLASPTLCVGRIGSRD